MSSPDKLWLLRARAGGGGTSFLARLKIRMAQTLYLRAQMTMGFWMPSAVPFGSKPYFPHGLAGVYISKRATIGADCVIFHHVTIGSNTLIDSRGLGAPTIGDRCHIGAGAKIIGGVIIGNDVRIGANAVVTVNVPNGATVTGVNQVSTTSKKRDNRYFREGAGGWESVAGGRVLPATKEEAARLSGAFGQTPPSGTQPRRHD